MILERFIGVERTQAQRSLRIADIGPEAKKAGRRAGIGDLFAEQPHPDAFARDYGVFANLDN